MRTIFLFIICIFCVILITPLLFICMMFHVVNPIYAIGKGVMHIGRAILGIQIHVYGLENIDRNETYVFMSNHLSFLDGPLLFMVIPRNIRFILKKEIFRIPIVGLGMKHVEFVPVDRKGIRSGKESIEKATRLIREKGYSFAIFPEGTRSRDGKMQAFKRGGFFMAVNSQKPIVPISIEGTFDLMPKGHFYIRKGKIRIQFHRPISTGGMDTDLLEKVSQSVRDVIQSGLDSRNTPE